MNLAIKGALLNALLFPGWGHIYLKRYKRGFFIIASILTGILSIVWSVVQTTINILRIAPIKKGTVTFVTVYQLTINGLKSLNLFHFSLIILFILLLWVLSIIDAYLLGKEEMAKSSIAADQQSTSPGD